MKIKIKKLDKYEFAKNYIYDEHAHKEHEINYINSGQCIMMIDGKYFALHKGDCVVIKPSRSHNFIVSGSQNCQVTQFEFLMEGSLLSIAYDECPKLSNCSDILQSMSSLHGYAKNQSSSKYHKKLFDLEFEKLFVLLNMHLERTMTNSRHAECNPLNQIVAYIDHHFDQDLNLDLLARKHHISARYLRKIFLQNIGFSASSYITMLRMEKAKDLLKNTHDSISEIALNTGYNSFPYFSTVFRENLGLTPKEFRKQYTLQ